MSSNETQLRAFCMSGAQIASEVREIEKRFGHALVDSKGSVKRSISDYTQFEGDVRRAAARMSEYYEIFYCLEVSIRNLVSATLHDAEGRDWWNSERVESGVRDEVNRLKAREIDSGMAPRSESPLDYLTFGQLSNIITNNFDLFQPVFRSKSAASRVMYQLNMLRNPIAHCCELEADEVDRLSITVRDWFRLFI